MTTCPGTGSEAEKPLYPFLGRLYNPAWSWRLGQLLGVLILLIPGSGWSLDRALVDQHLVAQYLVAQHPAKRQEGPPSPQNDSSALTLPTEQPAGPSRSSIDALLDETLPHFDINPAHLPIRFRRRVRQRLHAYTVNDRLSVQVMLIRAETYLPMIKRHLRQEKLPAYFAYLPLVESSFRRRARHPKSGARGLWQLMGATARSYGIQVSSKRDDRLHPKRATQAAVRFLQVLHKRLGRLGPLPILAAYNMGERKLSLAMREAQSQNIWRLFYRGYLPSETREYLVKMVALWVIAAHPERFNFSLKEKALAPAPPLVALHSAPPPTKPRVAPSQTANASVGKPVKKKKSRRQSRPTRNRKESISTTQTDSIPPPPDDASQHTVDKPMTLCEEKHPDQMVCIPEGPFLMGSDGGHESEKPIHEVHVNAFFIDQYEVSHQNYRNFIIATGHEEPTYWNDRELNQPHQPVVGVTWHDALAYCLWAGKRLPKEQEWEKAARGEHGLRSSYRYPWGNTPPDDHGQYRANYAPGQFEADQGVKTAPVKSFAAGVAMWNGRGLYHIVGNVREWTASGAQSSPELGNPPHNGSVKEPVYIARGGSWKDPATTMQVATRSVWPPQVKHSHIGFRCVLDGSVVKTTDGRVQRATQR